MATATIPTIQNGAGPLDNIINSVTRGIGSGTTTRTTGGFSDQLGALLNNLTLSAGPYGKEAAISDALGPMAQLAQDTLQSYVPRAAAQVRGSGLYNSSTKTLLDNDANAKLATAMASLVQKNVTDYSTLQSNAVNAAANANRTTQTQTVRQGGNTGKQIASAALPLLLGEGKKFLGSLFDDTTKSAATSAAGAAAGALGGAVESNIGGDSFLGPNAFLGNDSSLGGLSGLTGGDTDSGSDLLGSIGSGIGDIAGGVGDAFSGAVGGLGDIFSGAVGGIGDFLGNVGSSIGDFFGGLFADGGKVPVRDRGIGAVGDSRYGGGGKTDTDPATGTPAMTNLLKELFPNNIFDRTTKKREKDAALDTDAPAGKISGPQSKSGLDNMLIAVQGGEGILPPDVMEVPGVEDLMNHLIATYHKPVAAS